MEVEGAAEVLTLRVPDVQRPAGRRHRLHFHWGVGNQLHLHHVLPSTAAAPTAAAEAAAPSSAAAGAQVHVVTWGECSASQRRLAYDTLPLLLQLAEQQRAVQGPQVAQGMTAVESEQRTLGSVQNYAYEVSVALGRSVPTAGADAVRSKEIDRDEGKQRAVWELIESIYVQRGASAVVTEVRAVAMGDSQHVYATSGLLCVGLW